MKYFLFFLILFLMLFLLNNEQNVITVINNDEPIYNEYMLEVEEITTKNFTKYIKNIKVIAIIPNIEVSYESKINDKLKKYYFDFNTINKNILNFEKSFILNLKQCGFNNEATNMIVHKILMIIYKNLNIVWLLRLINLKC